MTILAAARIAKFRWNRLQRSGGAMGKVFRCGKLFG